MNKSLIKLKAFIDIIKLTLSTACSENAPNTNPPVKVSNSEFSVTSVNDYDFMFNDTDAGAMINFGSVNKTLVQLAAEYVDLTKSLRLDTSV